MNRAVYTWRRDGEFVFIWDICLPDAPSVTNDAEAVIRDLALIGLDLDNLQVVYRDSEGRWDGLLTRYNAFAGFTPLGPAALWAVPS